MDGSERALIIQSKFPKLLTVDHSSRLLFWVERLGHFSTGYSYQIRHSDLDGEGIKLTISLPNLPYKLALAGSRVFWTTAGYSTLSSCERDTANDFVQYKLSGMNSFKPNFLMVSTSSGIHSAGNDPCIPDALCSHMCIPSPTGYMRCLCPQGHTLMPNNWTCREWLFHHKGSLFLATLRIRWFFQNAMMLHTARCPIWT